MGPNLNWWEVWLYLEQVMEPTALVWLEPWATHRTWPLSLSICHTRTDLSYKHTQMQLFFFHLALSFLIIHWNWLSAPRLLCSWTMKTLSHLCTAGKHAAFFEHVQWENGVCGRFKDKVTDDQNQDRTGPAQQENIQQQDSFRCSFFLNFFLLMQLKIYK